MQEILRSRTEGMTVELMTAVVAGVAVLALGFTTVSRRKVCGRWIYILP